MFFLFNDTATTEIYTLSLPDALTIYHIHKCRIVLSNGKQLEELSDFSSWDFNRSGESAASTEDSAPGSAPGVDEAEDQAGPVPSADIR